MSSSELSDNDSENKKYRKQRFRPNWLQIAEFKGWLESVEDDVFKCKCKACDKLFNCGKSDLLKHAATSKHIQKVKAVKISKPMSSFFEKPISKETENFEVRMSMFFAEHNVAIHVIDHLIPLLKEIVPDSKIIKNCQLGRTKCTRIIENILAKVEKEKLVEQLKHKRFSVLIDESTDISSKKSMCVLVRFFDEVQERSIVQLLDLLPVGSDGSADALYKIFKNCMISHEIPLSNITGLCTDGVNTMVGQYNSFASRLLEDVPDAITIKCICHSAAIIANNACLMLPRAPEELIRQIGTYISGSSKRCSQLGDFQEIFYEEKRKILRTSDTRWLSRQKCIERILLNWNALFEYFKFALNQDKLKSAELIYNELSNECTKAYLLFLKYVLVYFNSMNALFQSKKTLVHVLHSESRKIFFKMGQNFIKKTELKLDCDLKSPHISLPINEIYVGNECEDLLKSIPTAEAYQIKSDCLKFYITAMVETKKRLVLKDNTIFKEMEFLTPEIALGCNKFNYKFILICQKFKINVNDLEQEWLTLEYNFSESQKVDMRKLDIEKFWSKICNLKNFNDDIVFPNFARLVPILMSLPHANADAERIFSIVTDVRTKKRNKLSHEVLNSICILRSYLQNNSLDCIRFKCDNNHFNKMKYKELYNLP